MFTIGVLAATGAASTPARADEVAKPDVVPGGYLETYYAYNFNRPSNGITNYRAFDDRHATFTLENAVLSVDGKADSME